MGTSSTSTLSTRKLVISLGAALSLLIGAILLPTPARAQEAPAGSTIVYLNETTGDAEYIGPDGTRCWWFFWSMFATCGSHEVTE